jgi:hypothetical protein
MWYGQCITKKQKGAEMPTSSNKIRALFRNCKILLGGVLIFCLAGCCPMGGRFNPESPRNVIALKQSHLQFVHEFTETEGKAWDLQQFDRGSQHMAIQFEEALTHSQTLSDKPRTSNIQLLKQTFHDDKELIHQKNRMLTSIESKTLLKPTTRAYNTALEAECIRRNGPGIGEACIPSDEQEKE